MSKMDSIDRLIDYTQSIKPYHTKIYEVLTNYTYNENIDTSITETFLTIPVPCECDPNHITAGIGWDTQPFGQFESVLLDTLDIRGNLMYGVVDRPDNITWGYPVDDPGPGPDECCVDCEVWLCENVGWDTQPYGLYAAIDTGTKDALGNVVYDTYQDPDNVEYDSPQECPDIGT